MTNGNIALNVSPAKAILVRVGIDASFGKWNAPADPESREFIYIPIPESENITEFHPNCGRRFNEAMPALQRFTKAHALDLDSDLRFPRASLNERFMHLDPDFEHLTYGDDGSRRGSDIKELEEGDLLVFYAGLRPTSHCNQKLIYAIIGLFVVDCVLKIGEIPKERWNENAHTRKKQHFPADIVVRAKPYLSGRLSRFLAIGEYRNGAYRVRMDLLGLWGGLDVKGGFIQRSVCPPSFNSPERFYDWFLQQNVNLVASNF